MLLYCLNLCFAIQAFPIEKDVEILTVAIKKIGDEGIFGFLD